jgi:hypothetical protein
VVPTDTPWSVSPKLPSPTSWGDVTTGLECTSSGGNLNCLTPGGHRFTVRDGSLPPGSYIGPGQPNYHYYSTPDGPVQVDPSVLTQGIIDSPTVGPPEGVRPATPEGTLNEATPEGLYGAFKNFVGVNFSPLPPGAVVNPVKSYLTTDQNGLPMAVNVTQPGHGLNPGVVVRYVTTSPSGSTIQNEGSGLGELQAPGAFFAGPIGRVWQGHARDIIKKMQRDSP